MGSRARAVPARARCARPGVLRVRGRGVEMSDRILTDDTIGTFTIGGDLTVRRLGFGAMRISGARNAEGTRDRASAVALVRRVVERGVNFIDTANIYGYGQSEEII